MPHSKENKKRTPDKKSKIISNPKNQSGQGLTKAQKEKSMAKDGGSRQTYQQTESPHRDQDQSIRRFNQTPQRQSTQVR